MSIRKKIDAMFKATASDDDNTYIANPTEAAMEFKFELKFGNRLIDKLAYAEDPSFEDAGYDEKKRPLIAVVKRSKNKNKLIFKTVGEAADFLYAIATGLFGQEDWDSYNVAQANAAYRAFREMKAAMSKEQIAAVNKLRRNVWSS